MKREGSRIGTGFVTALGTPLADNGDLAADSFRREIEMQIACGASGVFALGSMGMQCAVANTAAVTAAETAAEAVGGRVPLLFGVMDNSVRRVRDRITAVSSISLDGIVVTTPFYFVSEEDTLVSFFKKICAESPFPVYLYDLPGVTKMKITSDICEALFEEPNLAGIKTPDFDLALRLQKDGPSNWTVLYSNLDRFAEAWEAGIVRNLDGMFSCTPKSAGFAYSAFSAGDYDKGKKYLRSIISLRDLMAKYRILPSFTVLMNLLGCEGNFYPDYFIPVSDEAVADLKNKLIEMGELSK